MTKIISVLIVFSYLLYACTDNNPKVKAPLKFRSFEMSYTDGWTTHFSFFVDSNKSYLSSSSWVTSLDNFYYGILPDTIFNLVDGTCLKILCDSSIKSNDQSCYDCSEIAIQVVTLTDTIRIHQSGEISKELGPVINSLRTFLDSGSHKKNKASLLFETKELLGPIINSKFIHQNGKTSH